MILGTIWSLIGVFIISIIVFGGGQIFIPLFQSLWDLLKDYGNSSHLNSIDFKQVTDNFIIASNITPGVVSTKLAAFTGFVIDNGGYIGIIVLLLCYLVFVIPAVIVMHFGNILFHKISSKHFKTVIVYFQPIIIGILLALALQLFLAIILPHFQFNKDLLTAGKYDLGKYLGNLENQDKNQFFFNGWRIYVAIIWSFILVIVTVVLYLKKINLFFIILIAIVFSLIVLEPWL
ncbi:Chromate transporter family protein [[Mycoplasma] cavipharyngis]|uniref:chromate transporter n=1 Tax=[Mycoplasma] cavipharyngis TaxID=92757 RepID=UPI003703E99A